MNKNKVLILRGESYSCNLVRLAKRAGIETYVMDKFHDSPGKLVCDNPVNMDFSDYDLVDAFIEENKIDGVFSGYSDNNLIHAFEICKRNKLNFWGTKRQIDISINKELFRLMCIENEVSTIPVFYVGNNLSEAKNVTEYPAVIKPIDGSGSQGVYICWNNEDLEMYFEASLSHSKEKNIVIEKYMQGIELIADYILIDGEIKLQALGEKRLGDSRRCQPTNHANLIYFPSVYLEEFNNMINKKVIRMLMHERFNHGIVFIQFFYQKGEFYACEMGYRLGGCFSEIIEHYNEYSPIDCLMNYQLNGNMWGSITREELSDKVSPYFHGVGGVLTLLIRKGIIGKVIGIDNLYSDKRVVNILVMHKEGTDISDSSIIDNAVARLFIVEKNEDRLKDFVEYVYNKVKVLDVNGEEMLFPLEDYFSYYQKNSF